MSRERRFFDFLKARIGLDVASVGEAIIERAVRQRRTELKAADADQYCLHLQGCAEEQQALIEAVIVPETWFFRYPESFATLARLATSRLAELKGMRALRILSLPCSTGEEPYSVAMALFDAGLASHQFKVDGVDVSPLSVRRAKQGVYGKNSFRGQMIDFRQRHFTAEDEAYRLSQRVCEQVRLQVGNLLYPGRLASEPAYDFVFCRNLLIYFDPPTQHQVLNTLKALTREDGVLFVGPAEGNLMGRVGMRSIGAAQSFAFRRDSERQAPRSPGIEALPIQQPKPLAVLPARTRPLKTLPARPTPVASGPRINAASQLLSQIATWANAGKTADARNACEQYLQHYEPSAQVFFWQGLLSDVEGRVREARELYRKALYLDPQHYETLVHFAALLTIQGDAVGARRLQERAARHERAADSEMKGWA